MKIEKFKADWSKYWKRFSTGGKLLELVKVGNFCGKKSYMKVMAIEIKLSIKDYRDEIKIYLRDIINILKRSHTWKIQSIIVVNFIPSKDTDAFKNDNERPFKSVLCRYQIGLEGKVESGFLIINHWVFYIDSQQQLH